MSYSKNARMQQKRGTEAQWNEAAELGFVPLDGEIIIYLPDATHSARIKIGDGKKNVSQLNFIDTSEFSGTYIKSLNENGSFESKDSSGQLTANTLLMTKDNGATTIKIEIDKKLNTDDKDNAPTQNSNNYLTSGAIYTALQNKQNKLTIDTQLNDSSTNPVQNKVINKAIKDGLDNKQNKIYYNKIKGVNEDTGVITTWDSSSEPTINNNTKIDLSVNQDILEQMKKQGITYLYVENDNGVAKLHWDSGKTPWELGTYPIPCIIYDVNDVTAGGGS